MTTKFISSIRSETGAPVLLFALPFIVIYGEEKFKKKESEGWEAKNCTVCIIKRHRSPDPMMYLCQSLPRTVSEQRHSGA